MTPCAQCGNQYDEPAPSFCGLCGAVLRRAAATSSGDGDGGDGGELFDPLLGKVVGGRYRLLERIGAGGMGVVYKVEHAAMGKMAALKMLHPTLVTDREVVKRFRTEARAVSLLTHPNSVQVFDFGEAEGSLYMVMEWIRGEDLSAILAREGPLPWRRAAPLLVQICEALSEAHEMGIIHRDLKPENILVTRAGRGRRESVKVLDFGLAKLRAHGDMSTVTARGSLVGTPYYMSPEQIRGEEPDARADLYSLGGMMYRMITGAYPFDGPAPVAVLTAHLTETALAPSAARPDLGIEAVVDDLVMRCLARAREDRYASVDDLRAAIEETCEADSGGAARDATGTVGLVGRGESATGGEPRVSLPPTGMAPPAQLSREDFDHFERALRRRRWLGMATAIAVLAGAAGGAGYALLHASARSQNEESEPNNVAAQANPIEPGRTVRGHIGKRLSLENSDRDFFVLRVPARAPEGHDASVLRVMLSGLPNINLHLGVFDTLGNRVAEADGGGPGDAEEIPNLRLEPGEYLLTVREVWAPGRMATENVTDWYTLDTDLRGADEAEESEPDDTPASALPIVPGRAVAGYLSRAGDEDFFFPQGIAGGELEGELSGVPGVDTRVVVLPPGVSPLEDASKTPGARVFDSGGVGAAERFDHVRWSVGAAAPLLVVTRKDPPADEQGRRGALAGVATRYRFVVERTAAADASR